MDVFGDTKEVIKNRKSKKDRQYNDKKKKDRQYNDKKKKDRQYNDKKKDRQYNNQNKMDKMTMTYKALQTKLKIEQHEPHKKPG
jgi:hypothetical protein